MSVTSVRELMVALGALAFVIGGFVLMLSGIVPSARGWAVRFMLLGVLLAGAAALVTPEWLP